MSKTVGHLLLLTAVGCAVLFINLGAAPLWDRDEPRNAGCAREMMERGDWVVPTFNAELRVLKPAMKYWLMILAYHMFGVSEFAARFWSAVFALAGAWAVYFLGRRLFNPRAGLWAGLVLLSSALFLSSGHLAKIDAALAFFATLTVLLYATFAFTPSAGGDEATFTTPIPGHLAWTLVYAALGLGMLGKGFPGLVPVGVLGLFLLIVRVPAGAVPATWPHWCLNLLRPFGPLHFLRTLWLMRPLTGLVVVFAVAAPWYILVGIRTDGEFLRGFFFEHHVMRAMAPMESHNGPFLLYYLGTVIVGVFPWSVFLLALLIWLVRRQRQESRAAYVLLSCWVGVYVVLFSCAQTKLPSYIVPCFPGLAVLLGRFLDDLCTELQPALRFWVKGALVMLGLCGLGVVAGAVIATRFLPISGWLGAIGLPLTAGAIAAYVLLQRGRVAHALGAVAASCVVFNALAFAIGVPHVGAVQQQEAVCAALRQQTPAPRLASYGFVEPSWVFYAGRPIVPVCLGAQAVAPESRWKAAETPAVEFFRQGADCFIVTTDKSWEALRSVLGPSACVVADIPKFGLRDRWLVIGHTPTDATDGSTH